MFSLEAVTPYPSRMSIAAPDAEDDAALARRIIDRAPGRDAAAEAELCRRLGPRIRLYGLKHLRDQASAADLMQDVLVMVLQKLREGAIREPERVASFVLGTRARWWSTGGAAAAAAFGYSKRFPIDLLPPDEEAPEPLDTRRLQNCLAALPERERAVLIMTFYDDRPADAVAADLGLSAGNVRVIRHRGLERLRGCIEMSGATT